MAAKVSTRHRKSDRPGMQAYRCMVCKFWHCGAIKKVPRRKTEDLQ